MRRILYGAFVTLCLSLTLVAGPAAAQSEESAEHSAESVRPRIEIPVEVPDAARARPDFDVELASQAYVELLSEEQRALSNSYTDGGHWLLLWTFVYGLAVAWLLLSTRFSAKMRDISERISRRKPIQTGLYGIQYFLVTGVLGFPLAFYQGFVREHQYGMATQSFGPWFGDQFKGLLVTIILGSIAVMVIYGAIRKAPRTWWMWGGLLSVFMIILLIAIFPVFIAPLFNDYQRLEEGPLRDRILSMARANGIPADDVYWFDASRQTTRISANVSGLFGTMRISLNDNLLNHTSPEEIEAVMAHEMAHYVLHRVKRLVYTGIIIIVGFAFMKWGSDRALARWGEKWDLRSIGDTASLPLLAAVFSIYSFVITPIQFATIRGSETEADIVSLSMAQQPDGFARTAVRTSDYRKVKPSRLEESLLHHHPSSYTRIHRAMQWKSENLEEERAKGR